MSRTETKNKTNSLFQFLQIALVNRLHYVRKGKWWWCLFLVGCHWAYFVIRKKILLPSFYWKEEEKSGSTVLHSASHEVAHAIYAHQIAHGLVQNITLSPPKCFVQPRKTPRIMLNKLFHLGTTLAGPLMQERLVLGTYRKGTSLFPFDWIRDYSKGDYKTAIQCLTRIPKTTSESVSFLEQLPSQICKLEKDIRPLAYVLLMQEKLSQEEFLLLVSSSYLSYLHACLWYHGGKRFFEFIELCLVRVYLSNSST